MAPSSPLYAQEPESGSEAYSRATVAVMILVLDAATAALTLALSLPLIVDAEGIVRRSELQFRQASVGEGERANRDCKPHAGESGDR